MKTRYKIIGASVGFGLLFWGVDAVLEYLFFYEDRSLMSLLITDVPSPQIYLRGIVLAHFIIFGVLVAMVISRREQTERRHARLNRVLRAIRNVNQLIVREKDRARLIQGACEHLIESRGYHSAWIILLDDAGKVTLTAQSDLNGRASALLAQLQRDELPVCGVQTLAQGEAVIIPNPATTCADCPLAENYVGHSAIAVRLAYAGQVYGMLAISLPAHLTDDEEEQALLHEVAGDIAFALHSIELEAARAQAEAALRESREKFEHLFEYLPIGLSLTAPTGEVQANRAFYEMLGYSQHHDSLTWQEITYPDDVEESQAVIEALMAGEKACARFIKRYVHKNGSIIWAEVSTAARQDEDGRTRYFMTAVQDITERKRAEAALRESEQRYRRLFETMGEGVALHKIICDERGTPVDYLIIDVNPAYEKHTGIAPKAVINQRASEFYGAGEPPYLDIYARVAMSGDSISFEKYFAPLNRHFNISAFSPAKGQFATIFEDITERKAAEEALRESERRFRTVLANLPGGVFVHNLEGHFLLVNEAAVRNTGYSQEELLNMTVADIDPHSMTGDDRDHLWRQLDEGKSVILHVTHERKDGAQYPAEVYLSGITLKGKPVILAVALDITERKAAEQALHESQERFRLTFHTSPDAININRLEDGLYVDINAGFTQLTGFTREDVIGKTSSEIDIWYDLADRQRLVQGLRARGYYKNLEAQFRRKDGSVTTALMSASVISLQGVPHIISITRDISARKQAEEERARLATQVREQARQMEQILATVPTGVLLLDAEWRVLQANPVAKDDLAKLADVGVGDVLTQLGDRPLAELLTSPPTRGLWHEVQSNGNTFEVIARSMLLSTPANEANEDPVAEQWVLVINDVTREREIRSQLQQQERLAAVGQMAAGIAHDFNNIMAVVVLYAQLGLHTPNLPAKISERLEIISQQAKRATELIEQILDFSRRTMLERRPIDLLPLMKEQIKLLERTLPEHIEIELDYAPDAYTIHADPTRMQQMIMNLAVNARDAMLEGGVLRIALKQIVVALDQTPPLLEMQAGAWVRLTVADTGAGIPSEALPHIFEPFFTTKEPGKGSGLGLPQVHGIVGLHGGHIGVETRVGKGTTFVIYFPALAATPIALSPSDVAEMPQGRGEVILVVEDENTVRAALAATLEQLGYRVLAAANGQEALDILALRADEISLVLSDFVMPIMGGRALFGAMQQRGYNLPVVLLSGHPLEHELREMQDQGLADWMLKPPDIEQLAKMLAQALKGRA